MNKINNKSNHFASIQELVAPDMEMVKKVLADSLNSEVSLIREVSSHLIDSGGKRMRPMLTILAARAFGYNGDACFKVAAIVEFIHTATLLHDDVVDSSTMRRGSETANQKWGNEISVLVGDYVYSKTFALITEVDIPGVMKVLSGTTSVMAEGEVKQLMNRGNYEIDESVYMDIITAKTAKLFEVAAIVGALSAGADEEYQKCLASFGLNLGLAFQLVDDVLDYCGDDSVIGKNIGDDLAEGKPTLPLIYAMQKGSVEQSAVIKNAIKQGGVEHLNSVLDAVNKTGALDYVKSVAWNYTKKAQDAIKSLPDSEYKLALHNLASVAVDRVL